MTRLDQIVFSEIKIIPVCVVVKDNKVFDFELIKKNGFYIFHCIAQHSEADKESFHRLHRRRDQFPSYV